MEYLGARGTMIYEKKPEVENLVSDSLLRLLVQLRARIWPVIL